MPKNLFRKSFSSLKELYEKWTKLSDHGYKMINEIVNAKVQKEYELSNIYGAFIGSCLI